MSKLKKDYYKIVCHTDRLVHYLEEKNDKISICNKEDNNDWENYNLNDIEHIIEYNKCPQCMDILKDHPIGIIHKSEEDFKANKLEIPIMIDLPIYVIDKETLSKFLKEVEPKDLAIFLRENLGYFKKLTVALVEANIDLTSIANHKTDEE